MFSTHIPRFRSNLQALCPQPVHPAQMYSGPRRNGQENPIRTPLTAALMLTIIASSWVSIVEILPFRLIVIRVIGDVVQPQRDNHPIIRSQGQAFVPPGIAAKSNTLEKTNGLVGSV
jgi:hypothetical protein